MITNGEKWHYVVLISLSALLRGITGGNNNGDFYCLNCFQSYTTEKSMTAPFVIYADLESLLEEMNTCHNNPEKSTTKINKHTPFCYSVFTHCSFDTTKNKFDYYRSKNCMKIFCLDLREHAIKIINYEKKRNDKQKNKIKCIISKTFVIYVKKSEIIVIILENTEVLLMISVVFHNGSTYDYLFIIKELAEECEGEFKCLGENTEKYITFLVPIKDSNHKFMKISYKIKKLFIVLQI